MPETEADTCRMYVFPKLYEAGWTNEQINEQHNLDIKNPSAEEALEHLPPEQLVESILAKERGSSKSWARSRRFLEGAGK